MSQDAEAKPAIVVVPPIPPELRRTLEERFTLLDLGADASAPEAEVAVITSMGGADIALMNRLPRLRLVACNGTGLDRVDLKEAARRQVIVRNTPDEVTEDTADFALALIYATLRRVAEADRFVRAGRWAAERMPPSQRVSGRRVGVVGLGRIGEKIAVRTAAIGMQVSYTGPRSKPGRPYRFVPGLVDLAREVDVLVVSCALTPDTRELIDDGVLRALGGKGVLINVSRGELVHEPSLLAALEDGVIAGAGLDVFRDEPKIDPRFLALGNVVLAPHYAAVTGETRHAIATSLRDAISDFLEGRPVRDAATGRDIRRLTEPR